MLLGDEGAAEIQPAFARLRFEQRLVLLSLTGREEVDNAVSSRVQKLSDQTPVAPPPERLGAEEARIWLRKRRR